MRLGLAQKAVEGVEEEVDAVAAKAGMVVVVGTVVVVVVEEEVGGAFRKRLP